jgi:RimJ/RimL family protein N-acetyltransferase
MPLTFERTEDPELVRGILTHPKLYRMLSDDFSPACEDFQPVFNEHLWYVLVQSGSKVGGLFFFHPHNAICWEVHTCLLPELWGPPAIEAARGVIQWLWENTPCRRLITQVPDYNRLALKLAKNAGMRAYGRNPKSFQRHSQLHDVLLLGISKP